MGVAISSLADMRRLFDGIDLGKVSTSMTINATAPILLSLYVAVGVEQGIPQKALRGTTQNDILKEYIARNTYIYPPDASLRLTVDLIEYCAGRMPLWHPISISGYHIRESGANAVQELAFSFANAFSKLAACSCHAGSLVSGARGEFFGTGIPARNRDVSSGGGGPDGWAGRAICGDAAVGAGIGVSRCHGHRMAFALPEKRNKMDRVAKVNLATWKFFIGED